MVAQIGGLSSGPKPAQSTIHKLERFLRGKDCSHGFAAPPLRARLIMARSDRGTRHDGFQLKAAM
jgi:hypothetical protein